MSVAAPKSQAKEPIQLDIILVCRKESTVGSFRPSIAQATESARAKLGRLRAAGFELSRNDRRIVLFGQLLTTLASASDAEHLALHADVELGCGELPQPEIKRNTQLSLFD